MPQNNPRDREPRVIRVTRTSAARSAAAMLCRGANGIATPSKVNDSVVGSALTAACFARSRRRMAYLRCEEARRIERRKANTRLIACQQLRDQITGRWGQSDTGALMTVRMDESGDSRIGADEGQVIGREWAEPLIRTDHPHVAEDRKQPDRARRQRTQGV